MLNFFFFILQNFFWCPLICQLVIITMKYFSFIFINTITGNVFNKCLFSTFSGRCWGYKLPKNGCVPGPHWVYSLIAWQAGAKEKFKGRGFTGTARDNDWVRCLTDPSAWGIKCVLKLTPAVPSRWSLSGMQLVGGGKESGFEAEEMVYFSCSHQLASFTHYVSSTQNSVSCVVVVGAL